MKVIFLDIDGVLNHCATSHADLATTAEPLPIPIAPECMARLNRLIAETGAKIIISSSWRKFARWQDLGPALRRHGLVGDVIGETPDLMKDTVLVGDSLAGIKRGRGSAGGPFMYDRIERGWEIREWLARGVCSCGHGGDYHECAAAECYYNDHPSGVRGCLCPQFDGAPLDGFVILDDCADMDTLSPWLVLTDPVVGLADLDVERAKCLLEQSTKHAIAEIDVDCDQDLYRYVCGCGSAGMWRESPEQARCDNKAHRSVTAAP